MNNTDEKLHAACSTINLSNLTFDGYLSENGS
jgi:hypothetical protein